MDGTPVLDVKPCAPTASPTPGLAAPLCGAVLAPRCRCGVVRVFCRGEGDPALNGKHSCAQLCFPSRTAEFSQQHSCVFPAAQLHLREKRLGSYVPEYDAVPAADVRVPHWLQPLPRVHVRASAAVRTALARLLGDPASDPPRDDAGSAGPPREDAGGGFILVEELIRADTRSRLGRRRPAARGGAEEGSRAVRSFEARSRVPARSSVSTAALSAAALSAAALSAAALSAAASSAAASSAAG